MLHHLNLLGLSVAGRTTALIVTVTGLTTDCSHISTIRTVGGLTVIIKLKRQDCQKIILASNNIDGR